MIPKTIKKTVTTLLVTFVLLTSCKSLKTAIYDQHSYEQSISLKVDALDLMSKAHQPYVDHENEINNYLKEFKKLKEYEKNKENNEFSYEMLQLIGNPEKNLLGGFFKRWKTKKTIKNFMIKESKGQIEEAFDILIKYESNKNKEAISKYLNK